MLVFLSMLVSGNKENATTARARARAVGVHDQLKYTSPNLQVKQQEVEEKKSLRHHHSFEAVFASKRKVPNASDPLHNR